MCLLWLMCLMWKKIDIYDIAITEEKVPCQIERQRYGSPTAHEDICGSGTRRGFVLLLEISSRGLLIQAPAEAPRHSGL